MKTRAAISKRETNGLNYNISTERKKMRKSQDVFEISHEVIGFKEPENVYKAPVDAVEHPIIYEALVREGLMIIALEISGSEFLRKVTENMTKVYHKIGEGLYVSNNLPTVYGVVYFENLQDLPEDITTLIENEKKTYNYREVHIYVQSVAAVRALRKLHGVKIFCTV
jgi:hypothetical protein